MTVLYPGMESAESTEAFAALKELEIPARLNSTGEVEVRRSDAERARAQLAMQNFPKTTLPYDIADSASGLTTTDYEKREKNKQQLQNRLQDTIRQYDGVKNVVVTLDVPQDNGYPWSGESKKSTASVSLVLEDGFTPSRDQVSGIKFLVSRAVGNNMAPSDVAVVDSATWLNLKSRDENDESGVDEAADRLAFEKRVEESLIEKARNVLSLVYKPEDMRVSATVVVDYKKAMTESKQYSPSNYTQDNSGVKEHEEKAYAMSPNGLAQGVPGEENNTDTLPGYLDQDGDGTPEYVDYAGTTDYAVSYVLEQIEKKNAELVSATMAVMVKGNLNDATKQAMLEQISKATNISADNISLQNVVTTGEDDQMVVGSQGETLPKIDPMLLYIIGGGALLLLIILIILIVLLRRRKKSKKQREARAAEEAAREAEQQREREIEERKRQLKENAEINKKDDAITNEVRDFALSNPEITASLLRAWLKEDEE